MRLDLGEQLKINAIDRFCILPEEIVNRRAIGGGADASLAPGARGKEKSDSSGEDSSVHESPSFYSLTRRGPAEILFRLRPSFRPRVVGYRSLQITGIAGRHARDFCQIRRFISCTRIGMT
jgi:hypothetical protein